MIQRTYQADITPASGEERVVVSIRAFDQSHARELIEKQFGPVKQWWSEPNWKD